MGITRVSQKAEEVGNCGQAPAWGKNGKEGRAGLALGSLNNFSRLRGIEIVPGCLIPATGVIRVGA